MFLPAKCPECGGLVEVDNEKRAGICLHCGQPFVVEDAIKTFNVCYNVSGDFTTNHNYGKGTVVNIYEDKSKDFVIEGGVLKKYQGESLTPIIPEGIIAIDGSVFKESMITKITLPSTLKELCSSFDKGEDEDIYADQVGPFYGCKYLEEINLPEGLENIPDYSFYGCEKLTTMVIPNGVIEIGDCAFKGCTNLTSVTIPDTVDSVGMAAFEDCINLTSIIIPESVTCIGAYAFYRCTSLEKVYWNARFLTRRHASSRINPDIKDAVFGNAGISGLGIDLVFGDAVKVIPADLCYIDDNYNKPNIKSITIGENVTNIASYAFCECTKLESVTFLKNIPEVGAHAFSRCENLTSVAVPDGVDFNIEMFKGSPWYKAEKAAQWEKTSAEIQKRWDENKSKGLCQYCGGTFKEGFFSVKCSKCGRTKDY